MEREGNSCHASHQTHSCRKAFTAPCVTAHLLLQAVTALLRDVHDVKHRGAQVGQRSDGLRGGQAGGYKHSCRRDV